MPADGGEAQQLTKMEKGVSGFEWAPDSKRIALSARGSEAEGDEGSQGELRGVSRDPCATTRWTHLWLLDLPKTDEAGRVSAVGEPKR